jgi:hypothetical protein
MGDRVVLCAGVNKCGRWLEVLPLDGVPSIVTPVPNFVSIIHTKHIKQRRKEDRA